MKRNDECRRPHCEEDMCDITPGKICDNCERCLGLSGDYLTMKIDGTRGDRKAKSKRIWHIKRDDGAL